MIKAVICGTFRRDTAGLYKLYLEIETCGVKVLSPIAVDFINSHNEVAKTREDENLEIDVLETMHLRAMRGADFIWLHAPDGYVGLSTSFEIGYATSRNIPIFSSINLSDKMLNTRVVVYKSVFEALFSSSLVS